MNRPRWSVILPLALVGCLFWATYFHIGTRLGTNGTLHNNVFFHSDTDRVIDDMCLFKARHRRTNVHPLFVLITNPVGVLLATVTPTRQLAALLLNSFSGGLCIAFAGWFFVTAGLPLPRALLLSAILGCSAGHLFFGSAPETFSLSALSLMVLFQLVQTRPNNLRSFVPAGIFSFGLLLTNLSLGALAFGASMWETVGVSWRFLRRAALFLLLVVVLSAGLAIVQKVVWPRSEMFFAPSAYHGESRFFSFPKEWKDFEIRETRLFTYMIGFDWFAPETQVLPDGRTGLSVRMNKQDWRRIDRPGRTALKTWVILLGVGAFAFFRYRLYTRGLPLGLLLGLVNNFALHSLYGDDFFLYACNSCFLSLAWAFVCIKEIPLRPWLGWLLDGSLLFLLVFEMINNERFIAALLEVKLP